VKHILEELNGRIGALGSMVVSSDGLLVAAVVGQETQLDRLAAMGAAILSDVRRTLAKAGMQDFTQCEVAAERGKVILVQAGKTYLLVLVGPRMQVGPGSVEILSAARQVDRAGGLDAA
jgi:hypothetical protein